VQQTHRGWWEGDGLCFLCTSGLGRDLRAKGWSLPETRSSRTAETVWEALEEESKRALEKCQGLCWRVCTQVRANGSTPVATWTIPPPQAAGIRCGHRKLIVGFTVTNQLQ